MSHHPSTLIALTPSEQKLFFEGPSGGYGRLEALLPGAKMIHPKERRGEWEETIRALRPEIIISGWSTPPVPQSAENLCYVCHLGGTVKHHVSRQMIERGVLVSNWGDCISETVAEAALLLILSALRRSHHYAHLMHVTKGWVYPPDSALSLFGRRVGIHGFGAIVRRLIPLLRPFRTPITVYSPGVPASDYVRHGVTPAASLEDLFSSSDVLLEIEALTPATVGVVSERILNLLPPGSTFVNLGRGAIVDESALTRLASAGRLRCALDVYQTEPLPAASPLRDLSEVVLFPHQGGPTSDRAYLAGDFALENLGRFRRGEPIEARISLEILTDRPKESHFCSIE